MLTFQMSATEQSPKVFKQFKVIFVGNNWEKYFGEYSKISFPYFMR